MANRLWDDWTSANTAAVITGTVWLRPYPSLQRDSAVATTGGTKTLATTPFPIAVTDSKFSVSNIPPGTYEVDLDLRIDDDTADVELTSSDGTAVINVAATGDQQLRSLLQLGVVAESPSARLEAIVTEWLADNPPAVSNSTVAAMVTAAGATKTALDASYATPTNVSDGDASTLTTATGRAITYSIALGV